jgi:hypothetical protein
LDEIGVCKVDEDALDECTSDESNEIREMLREALTMRMQLDELRGKIRDSKGRMEKEASYASMTKEEDHAFNHYVDYRRMAQYESH